jgi:hypothetical protein
MVTSQPLLKTFTPVSLKTYSIYLLLNLKHIQSKTILSKSFSLNPYQIQLEVTIENSIENSIEITILQSYNSRRYNVIVP